MNPKPAHLTPSSLAPTPAPALHIRWMIRRDLEEVLSIERAVFEFPWSEVDITKVLHQHNNIGMVVELCDRIVGYMFYSLQKTRIELLNLAVAEDQQRRGVGRQMIEKLKKKLSRERRTRIVTHVRESNLPAHLFFHFAGFRATAVVPGFFEYASVVEDAYRFVYRWR